MEMKVKLHQECGDGSEDWAYFEGDSVEEIKKEIYQFINERGIEQDRCWTTIEEE